MDRDHAIGQIENTVLWDVLVIGGGASGLGAALDASSRGYRTLVVEIGDFAQGTSSRSTKLIHGGIRYLPQGRLLFIRQALQERANLIRNAPHLVHALSMILPSSNWFDFFSYSMGIKLYDLLAGTKNFPGSKLLSKSSIQQLVPTLDSLANSGGLCFFDGQFDDARLAISLAQTIVDRGGCVVNYMKVHELIKAGEKVHGVIAQDLETGHQHELFAKVVINATGGYVDAVRRMDDSGVEPSLILSQGTHIVLSKEFFPFDHAVIIPKSIDGRILFVIPWYGKVLIGTTDNEIDAMTSEPKAKEGEIEFLLKQTANVLTRKPSISDILSVFTGVRSIIKPQIKEIASSKLSREHTIVVSDSQLVSLLGGKWTTYRQIGEEAINTAAEIAKLPYVPSCTKALRIHGWTSQVSSPDNGTYYGSDLPYVNDLGSDNLDLLKKMHPDLPCRGVDVIWAVRHEMARTLEDVLSRRSRSLLLGARESMEIAAKAASLMAAEMKKNKDWEEREVSIFKSLAAGYLPIHQHFD